jgi:hypothetical protein
MLPMADNFARDDVMLRNKLWATFGTVTLLLSSIVLLVRLARWLRRPQASPRPSASEHLRRFVGISSAGESLTRHLEMAAAIVI